MWLYSCYSSLFFVLCSLFFFFFLFLRELRELRDLFYAALQSTSCGRDTHSSIASCKTLCLNIEGGASFHCCCV